MIIYKVTNLQNGHFYIGMSEKTLKERWKSHLDAAAKGRTKIYKAMRSYGTEAFTIELLEECPNKKTMEERENYYLQTLTPHYNTRLTGGTGGDTSYTENHIAARDKMRVCKGTKWFNNGIEQKRLHPGSEPPGWVNGRLFNKGTHPNKITETFSWTCQACGKTEVRLKTSYNLNRKYCNLTCNGSTIGLRRSSVK